jgi:hypothetical protein
MCFLIVSSSLRRSGLVLADKVIVEASTVDMTVVCLLISRTLL